jgi:hypothetical protein
VKLGNILVSSSHFIFPVKGIIVIKTGARMPNVEQGRPVVQKPSVVLAQAL